MSESGGSPSPSAAGSYWKFWTWSWRDTAREEAVSNVHLVPASTESGSRPKQPTKGNLSESRAADCLQQSVSTTSPAVRPGWVSGWERIKTIYTAPVSMERDVIERVVRMTFFAGFLMGGAGGYAQAQKTYELNNQGRKYLSASDAAKRRIDYAIVRFAKGGFSMGFKCALISGSIILLTTHLSTFRNRFSSFYLPGLSGAIAVSLHTVGSVFVFPLGVVGAAKAAGLGVTSGLTLAAVVQLYALSVDKSSNEAYWQFKRDYERELNSAVEFDRRVSELMEAEKIMWRQTAVKRLKQMDEEALNKQDF